MNSLEKICLCSVARNASCYKIDDFKALNVYILQQLVMYLGAYQLNRLHDIFVEAGVDVDRVWKKYLVFHWTIISDLPVKGFNSDKICVTESRRVYLERLFQQVIASLDPWADEPWYVTNLKRLPRCRHGICFQCLDSTALNSNILHSDLLQYAVHVQVLTIGSRCPTIQYLHEHPNLLRILQRTVRRLSVHHINARNFLATREFVRLFVAEGSVSEFTSVKGNLPSSLLENLLRLVSGQPAEQCCRCSLSTTTVIHPIVEIETRRSLEDEASIRMESKEEGGCLLAGCSDVDILNEMVTVDESKKLTGADGMGLMSSQASESLVESSDCDLADDDDDLYDVALTTSRSNTNRSRSGGSWLAPRVPPTCQCCANGSEDGATVNPCGSNTSSCNDYNTSALHLRNSQFGCELPNNTQSSSAAGCDNLSPRSASPPRSCTSFTLKYYSGTDTHNVLVGVLRNWTDLRKLSLFNVSGLSNPCGDAVDFPGRSDLDSSTEDLPIEETRKESLGNFLRRSIRDNQLTHIILIEVHLDVIHVISHALRTKLNNHPLEGIKITLHEADIGYQKFTDFTEQFFGTICLDFCKSYVDAVTTCEFIMSWIRFDRALQCLHLPSFDDSRYLTEALQILECNQTIEELHVNDNIFDVDVASSLVSMLQSCPSLRKLSLVDCDLFKNLIDGKLFVETISLHPTLTELNLKNNSLEDVSCDLLKAICLRKAFFSSLDLSFNRIEGKLLFETCQEIQTELRKQRRSRFPLSELDVSGNIFHQEWRYRLVQTFTDCVDVFVVRDPNLGNPAGSLADHISQM